MKTCFVEEALAPAEGAVAEEILRAAFVLFALRAVLAVVGRQQAGLLRLALEREPGLVLIHLALGFLFLALAAETVLLELQAQ